MTEHFMDGFFEEISVIKGNLLKMSKINKKILKTPDQFEENELCVKYLKVQILTKTKLDSLDLCSGSHTESRLRKNIHSELVNQFTKLVKEHRSLRVGHSIGQESVDQAE